MKKDAIDIKYLTINEMDTNWGLTVTTVGCQNIEPHTVYPPQIHQRGYYFDPDKGRVLQEYQLIYITHGEGFFQSDSIPLTKVVAGTAIMLFPGQWHSYRPDWEIGWSEYWVGFSGSYAEQLVQNNFFSKEEPLFDIGIRDGIVELMVRIMDKANLEKIGFQQLISGATTYILGQLYSIRRNREFGNKVAENIINNARILMREKITEVFGPEDVAEALNIGYSWFRKTFKEYTGLAPAQYQIQLKVQVAKEWLSDDTITIKEIAFRLNFNSHFHFSSLFRQKTGVTPSLFRRISLRKVSGKDIMIG